MTDRVVFFNVGWMKDYQGITGGDGIQGGGSYVSENEFGHEIYNFSEFNGQMYGYVQPPGYSINIDRLGAHSTDDWIDGVIVVWVSTAPKSGSVIVGWYENARIYRDHQDAPRESERTYKGQRLGYYCAAQATDCTLLAIDSRTFAVPRGKGGMGQSNVWYADKEEQYAFRQKVLEYILRQGKIETHYHKPKTDASNGFNRDPLLRQKIERAAVDKTIQYYENLGYSVTSVETDHVGWDLEACQGKRKLLLEVKGLSGQDVGFDLTPNEFEKMKANRDTYRICALTSALSDSQQLHIFSYSPDSGNWESEEGERLNITPQTGARVRV